MDQISTTNHHGMQRLFSNLVHQADDYEDLRYKVF